MFSKIFLIVAVAELCVARHLVNETLDLKITNGNTVDPPHSVPWIVHIEIENPKDSCGGTLISENHVLTAAHCVKGNRTVKSVVAGAFNINENEDTQQKFESDSVVIHSKYNDPKFANDIAIIKLKTSATINDNVKVMSLAPASDASAAYANKRPSLYGWGLISDDPVIDTNTLQVVKLRVLPNADCKKKAPNKDVFAGDLCTDSIMERSFCDGDSGGPLILNNVQIGVIARLVSASCLGSHPGVYTKVGYYRSWIDSTIQTM